MVSIVWVWLSVYECSVGVVLGVCCVVNIVWACFGVFVSVVWAWLWVYCECSVGMALVW